MTLDEALDVLNIALKVMAFGYFAHGMLGTNTHSLVVAAVFLLITQS